MKARTALLGPLAVLVVLAAPASAQAAVLVVSPSKPCFRSGELVGLGGSGYTPGRGIDLTSDSTPIGTATANPSGVFAGALRVAQPSGERIRTYTATEQGNPAITASIPLQVSAFGIRVTPGHFTARTRFRISARGFTTGRTLYAHLVRGRARRTVRIGRLRGACRRISTRRRLFRRRSRLGTYTLQFDTRRRYSSRTGVRKRFAALLYASSAGRAAGVRLTPLR